MTRFPVSFRPAAVLLVLAAGLAAVGAPAPAADADAPPVKALLVLGGCCHDYKAQKDLITQGISKRANVSWAVSYDPTPKTNILNPIYKTEDWAKGYDVIVHDECSADVKDLETVDRILKPHKDGVPGVVLHCGMHSYRSEGFPKA
ncbi:MAG: ThuA domain-containing protein, partial [Fimbriiglobus sp.]